MEKFKYLQVLTSTDKCEDNMLKQISLSVPEKLLKASKEYTEELGYRNIQEFILELLRKKVILERLERYKKIEKEMKKGKEKTFTQKEAIKYIKNL